MELSSILLTLAKYVGFDLEWQYNEFHCLAGMTKYENFNADIHFGLMFAFYTSLHIFTRA